jgi:hypothetical protein
MLSRRRGFDDVSESGHSSVHAAQQLRHCGNVGRAYHDRIAAAAGLWTLTEI